MVRYWAWTCRLSVESSGQYTLTIVPAKAQRNMKVLARFQALRGFASEIGYEERTMRHDLGSVEQRKCRREAESPCTEFEVPRFAAVIRFGKSLDRSSTMLSPPSPPYVDPNIGARFKGTFVGTAALSDA